MGVISCIYHSTTLRLAAMVRPSKFFALRLSSLNFHNTFAHTRSLSLLHGEMTIAGSPRLREGKSGVFFRVSYFLRLPLFFLLFGQEKGGRASVLNNYMQIKL
jgi:hypothetical protein